MRGNETEGLAPGKDQDEMGPGAFVSPRSDTSLKLISIFLD